MDFVRKGIALLERQVADKISESDLDEEDELEIKSMRRKLSCAYGSLAEIYMTDCWCVQFVSL
jgi:hypothetical protein